MKLKIDEINKMSAIEREKKIEDLRAALFKLRSSVAMGGTLPDPSEIKQTKRSIARMLTVMNQLHEI